MTVRKPTRPSHKRPFAGAYVLGVECDGFQYHSSKVARDRDRLREQVLRGLGWRLHRIWGTAWHRNRSREEERLREAIEEAVAAAPAEGRLGGTDVDRIERPSITTETAIFDSTPKWALPYAIAHVPPLAPWIDPGDIASRFAMVDGIRAVVGIEGPVHVDVLDQRLRQAWSIGRIGRNIRDNIDAAMGLAGVIRDGEFARMNGAVPAIRMPSQGCARTVRQVHDDELAQALERFVRDAGGITADDLTGAVARIYGWNRRGAEIVSRMEALIDSLVSTRRLQRQAGGLSAGE